MARIALVTGGSRGIGEAIVQTLARDGCEVLAPDRSELDLADSACVAEWCARHSGERIDILVNNAGINELATLQELDDKRWRRMEQVNLHAPIALMRALVPGMAQRRWGRVVNVTSIWAHVGRPHRAGYAATKAGLLGFTRTVALEWAPEGVIANCISPGFTATELTMRNNPPHELEAIRARIPAGRLAEPAEIAEAVAWLVSDRNSYMTGQCLCVDGGYTIQ